MGILDDARKLAQALKSTAQRGASNLKNWGQVLTTPQLRQDYSRYVAKPAVKSFVNQPKIQQFKQPIQNITRPTIQAFKQGLPAMGRLGSYTNPFINFQSRFNPQVRREIQPQQGDVLKTAKLGATAFGLTKLKPLTGLAMGGFGGVANKLGGGSFTEGFTRGVGQYPQLAGVVGMTDPLISKTLGRFAPQAGKALSRVGSAGANVLQGLGIDKATGMPTTPGSIGLDVATGALFGPGQFETGAMAKGTVAKKTAAKALDKYRDGIVNVIKRYNSYSSTGKFDPNLDEDVAFLWKELYGKNKKPPQKLSQAIGEIYQAYDGILTERNMQSKGVVLGFAGDNKKTQPTAKGGVGGIKNKPDVQGGLGDVKLYRGGQPFEPTRFTGESGLSLTTSKQRAKFFTSATQGKGGGETGRIVQEFKISPNAKVATIKDVPNKLVKTLDPDQISGWAKKQGYDVIDLRKLPGELGKLDQEVRILNPKVVNVAQPPVGDISDVKLKAGLEQPKTTQLPQSPEVAASKKAEVRLDKDRIKDSFGNIIPPKARGNIQSPELNFSQWKDKATPTLSRETMLRNIEDIAGKDSGKVKDFLIKPLRENDTKLADWSNNLRQEVEGKVKQTGIKKGSKEDALIQRYGEGRMTLSELKQKTKKWEQVKEMAEYFRGKYDELLENINKERAKFDYSPIPKRQDYFRHYQEIGNAINSFGLILRQQDLPTEISGMTHIFKPGKPFTTAELQRKGGPFTESAIGGFDNYIDSIGRQLFHIDTVQRGRALEKYIRQAGAAGEAELPNFVSNLYEWTNLVSGKKARLDRAFEDVGGRQVYGVANWVRGRTSANMVGGNVASALTNYIPLTQAISTTNKPSFFRGMLEAVTAPLEKKISIIGGQKSSFLTKRFRKENIAPTAIENVKKTAGWLFDAVDKFVAKTVVGGKYYENLKKGMSPEEAMRQADDYASRLMQARTIGELPNLMNTRTLGLITQFQTEVNNQLSFLTKDIPRMSEGNKLKMASALMQVAIFSHLYNNLYEKIAGRRPAVDPINYGMTALGMTEESEGEDIGERLLMAGKGTLEALPFTGTRLPIGSAIPDVAGVIKGEADLGKELIKPLAFLVPPTGGGQIKKTIEGLTTAKEGASYTPSGRTRFTVESNPLKTAQMATFGQWSIPEAKEYIGNLGKSKTDILYKDFQKLKTPEEKAALWDQYVKEGKIDKAMANRLKQKIKDEEMGITRKEEKMRNLPVKDRSTQIKKQLDKLKTPQEKAALWDDYVKKKIITKEVAKQLKQLISEEQ